MDVCDHTNHEACNICDPYQHSNTGLLLDPRHIQIQQMAELLLGHYVVMVLQRNQPITQLHQHLIIDFSCIYLSLNSCLCGNFQISLVTNGSAPGMFFSHGYNSVPTHYECSVGNYLNNPAGVIMVPGHLPNFDVTARNPPYNIILRYVSSGPYYARCLCVEFVFR